MVRWPSAPTLRDQLVVPSERETKILAETLSWARYHAPQGDQRMTRRTLIAIVCLLSALNVIALAVNVSLPSRAAVGGMSYQELVSDPDFTRAVKSIAEQCSVNVDIARLKC